MRAKREGVVLVACLVLYGLPAFAQDLTRLDAQQAQRVAEMLVEKAAEIKSPQVKLQADMAKAVGLRYRKDGILVVPRKGLGEQQEDAEVRSEHGAALAYLFMSSSFSPVVKGKPVDQGKLRSITVVDRQGIEHTVTCLLLAVRRTGQDDWRLYVYGAEQEPLIDAPFAAAENEKPGPVALDIENVMDTQGTLVVTVLGKYRAGLRVEYRMD